MLLMIIVSWAKAGLAGDWILYTINVIVFLVLISNYKTLNYKHIIPFILLIVYFIISYFNPSYKILDDNDWRELDIEKNIPTEKNVEKVKFFSENINLLYNSNHRDPDLNLALYFHTYNKYKDNFLINNSPVDNFMNLLIEKISLKPIKFLPSVAIKHKNKIFDFIHFFFQLFFGIAVYNCLNNLAQIRKIILILSCNTLIITIFGIVQKLNYIPSDNLNEIWGIWDTPEPRYFFASFTYKNHWSCFAIMSIFMIFSIQNKFVDKFYLISNANIIYFISLITIIISIPLSGSRSGTIICFLSVFILIIFLLSKKRSFNYFRIILVLFIISSALISILWFSSKLDNDTFTEMKKNSQSQINSLQQNKLPLRVLLWNDLVKQISQKPLLGFGFNSYRSLNPYYQSIEVREERNKALFNAHHEFIPLIRYAHNDWLEKLSEFGFLGLLPFLPFLIALTKLPFTTKSQTSRILSLGVIVYFAYSFIDFPSRNPCCFLTFTMISGLALKYNHIVKEKYNV